MLRKNEDKSKEFQILLVDLVIQAKMKSRFEKKS
jgi:hypothetical protein